MSDAETAGAFACEECLQPAEAFAVIGNETRLAILEALWEAPERPVSFSDLRRRVGTRDSAQFNYHLQKLTGQFVRKCEEGYDFRGAGRAVIQAVLSGSLNQDPEFGPVEVEGECVDCSGSLVAHYEDETLRIVCDDCGRRHAHGDFPPGGLEDRTKSEVMDAFNQRVRHLMCLISDGVCPACNGRTETNITETGDFVDYDVHIEHECQRCGQTTPTSVTISLLDDAEVVSFYRDHGIDLNAAAFWTLEWCVSDDHTEVLSENPWEFRVHIELDDERLVVDLDEDLVVEDASREPL
ncbi:winged helix-turn-helix domain-containing protein [Natronomonas sp.]|uniref:winged helix-turn-helix domain-containing protein n=1 Tax=Natronomonas sp. TaxID=2184060 RepID=UPI002FC38B7F